MAWFVRGHEHPSLSERRREAGFDVGGGGGGGGSSSSSSSTPAAGSGSGSRGESGKIPPYDSLRDPALRFHFEKHMARAHLYDSNLVDRSGRVLEIDACRSKIHVIDQEFEAALRSQPLFDYTTLVKPPRRGGGGNRRGHSNPQPPPQGGGSPPPPPPPRPQLTTPNSAVSPPPAAAAAPALVIP